MVDEAVRGESLQAPRGDSLSGHTGGEAPPGHTGGEAPPGHTGGEAPPGHTGARPPLDTPGVAFSVFPCGPNIAGM